VQGTRAEPEVPFVVGPMEMPEDAWRTIALDDLVQFYRNPTRFFLRERLGLRLEAARGEVDTREPFVLDALERYRLCDEVLRLRRADVAAEEIAALVRAAGLLPHGVVGDVALEAQMERLEGLVERLAALAVAPGTVPLAIDVTLGEFRVHGAVTRSRLGGVVDFRPTSAKPGDRVGLWIRHLALACADAGGESRWLGTDETVVLQPVAEPRALLADLVALYWDGLRRPLPFFPKASYAACEATGDPIAAARKEWESSDFAGAPPGDGDDAYNALAFRGRQALDDEFLRTAHRVLDPMRKHQRDENA
jgi:exodeoxyribonuclease V gamma subunit